MCHHIWQTSCSAQPGPLMKLRIPSRTSQCASDQQWHHEQPGSLLSILGTHRCLVMLLTELLYLPILQIRQQACMFGCKDTMKGSCEHAAHNQKHQAETYRVLSMGVSGLLRHVVLTGRSKHATLFGEMCNQKIQFATHKA